MRQWGKFKQKQVKKDGRHFYSLLHSFTNKIEKSRWLNWWISIFSQKSDFTLPPYPLSGNIIFERISGPNKNRPKIPDFRFLPENCSPCSKIIIENWFVADRIHSCHQIPCQRRFFDQGNEERMLYGWLMCTKMFGSICLVHIGRLFLISFTEERSLTRNFDDCSVFGQ